MRFSLHFDRVELLLETSLLQMLIVGGRCLLLSLRISCLLSLSILVGGDLVVCGRVCTSLVVTPLQFGVLDTRASSCFSDCCMCVLRHRNVAKIGSGTCFFGCVSANSSKMLAVFGVVLSISVMALAQVLACLASRSNHMVWEYFLEGA